tara:strand:- start:95 stop:355 length:261 start_codon:yes stop_codon:yes gene_type:complete
MAFRKQFDGTPNVFVFVLNIGMWNAKTIYGTPHCSREFSVRRKTFINVLCQVVNFTMPTATGHRPASERLVNLFYRKVYLKNKKYY